MNRLALFSAGAFVALMATALPARAQAACAGGTATLGGVTYACSGVDLLAVVSPQTLGAPPNGACPTPYPNICATDVWGWTDDSKSLPFCCVVPELPPDMKPGVDLSYEGVFVGYFL